MTRRPVVRGLGLPAKLKGTWPVRYNAVVAEGRLLVMAVVDDIKAVARGLRLRLANRGTHPLYPRYELSQKDLGKLLSVLSPATSVTFGGRSVPARWTLELTAGGSLRLVPEIDGVLEALEGGHGARLAIEGGDLVETVDTAERRHRETHATARDKQLVALAKAKPALLKAIGAKRATLVDDDDDGWPFLRASARFDRDRLLALQSKVPGVLVADDWKGSEYEVVDGVRLYAPMKVRELVLGVVLAPDDSEVFGKMVDALVGEAGARVVHVDSRTLHLWPTKRRGALTKSLPLLRTVCRDPELEAKPAYFANAVRAGEMLVFWWD